MRRAIAAALSLQEHERISNVHITPPSRGTRCGTKSNGTARGLQFEASNFGFVLPAKAHIKRALVHTLNTLHYGKVRHLLILVSLTHHTHREMHDKSNAPVSNNFSTVAQKSMIQPQIVSLRRTITDERSDESKKLEIERPEVLSLRRSNSRYM